MTSEKKRVNIRWKNIYREYGKRVLDVLTAYILLIFLYVPMLFISVAVKISSSGPVIFKQIRVGADGRRFVCYKFRTMRVDAPPNLPTSSFFDAEDYVTPIGRFLRRTSLDELPQLFNVMSGDMSMVGPRPLISEEREMHSMRRELGVYSLRPGITGLAQIRGRDMISDSEKAAYDSEYASDMCFLTDARIVFGTIFKIISADGVKRDSAKEQKLDKSL